MLNISRTDKVARGSLATIPITPRGSRSARWMGVQHRQLTDAMINGCKRMGLRIMNEAWSVNESGSDLYGVIDFGPYGDIPKGMSLSLGVKHSNASRFAITFVVGAKVSVCDNGLITGGFIVKRRHTTGLELSDAIQHGLDRFLIESRDIRDYVEDLQEAMIVDMEASNLIVHACDADIISWSHAKEVWKQWKTPTYGDFSDRSLWSLHNAHTEVVKDYTPQRQMASLTRLKALFTNTVAERN